MRASEALSSCELGVTSCVLARLDLLRANVEFGRAFRLWAPHYVALNVRCLDVRTLPYHQRVDGRESRAGGRGSLVDGHGSRFRRSGATLSSRGTSITRTFGRCGTSSMSPAAFRPPPFPMRGPMSIGTDCRNRRKSCPCQLEDNAFRRSISCARARRVRACERCDFFLRARRDFLRANVNLERRFVFRATLNRAERLFVAQTFGPFRVVIGSRVDGRGSMVAGR